MASTASVEVYKATAEGYTYKLGDTVMGPDALPAMLSTIDAWLRKRLTW